MSQIERHIEHCIERTKECTIECNIECKTHLEQQFLLLWNSYFEAVNVYN